MLTIPKKSELTQADSLINYKKALKQPLNSRKQLKANIVSYTYQEL